MQHFAAAMAGGLLLLRDRLRQVERVVMGIENPSVLLCRANEADPCEEGPGVLRAWSGEEVVERRLADLSPGDPNENDVRLEAWSDVKLARHHRVEWKRARTRARTRRRTKEQPTAG